MRNSNRGRGVLAAAVVGVAAALAAAVPANAAPPAPAAANCILVVQGAPTADKTLPVKEVCGDAARAKVGAADFQPIVTLYEHAGWGGWSQTLYGGYGTCDHDGYNFEISDWWKANLSSYRVHGACYWSSYVSNSWWSTTSYGHIGDVDYVGDTWNDNTRSVRTWARS